MDKRSYANAKARMGAKDTHRSLGRRPVRQRCPACGVRMTRVEATDLGRCADCASTPPAVS